MLDLTLNSECYFTRLVSQMVGLKNSWNSRLNHISFIYCSAPNVPRDSTWKQNTEGTGTVRSTPIKPSQLSIPRDKKSDLPYISSTPKEQVNAIFSRQGSQSGPDDAGSDSSLEDVCASNLFHFIFWCIPKEEYNVYGLSITNIRSQMHP